MLAGGLEDDWSLGRDLSLKFVGFVVIRCVSLICGNIGRCVIVGLL